MSEQVRPYTRESGKGRMDRDGIEWFACDPYPTWYRREDGALIRRDHCSHDPLVHQCDEHCPVVVGWADE